MSSIVLAVYPSVSEALPALERALGGAGKPEGVMGVRRHDGGVIVEWDPERTAVRLVMGIIDAELCRYNATRRTELLSSPTTEQLALIAAQELRTQDIAPDRVLEVLLARAGFGDVACT